MSPPPSLVPQLGGFGDVQSEIDQRLIRDIIIGAISIRLVKIALNSERGWSGGG